MVPLAEIKKYVPLISLRYVTKSLGFWGVGDDL